MSIPIDVGIDFGTTNCAIGRVYPDGRMPIRGPLPSIGVWHDGTVTYGEDARRLLASEDPAVYPIRDLKLLLGQPERLRFNNNSLDPVDIAAGLFRHVKNSFFAQDEVNTAVVGTPVRASREHRLALREAAQKAGFRNLRFVYEPTAALVGSWEGRQTGEDLVLVVDWGGGTLDLAAIRVEGSVYREISVDCESVDLGGSRIDNELTLQLLGLAQNRGANTAIAGIEGGLARFSQAVEEKKISILDDPYGEEAESELINPSWLPNEVELSPRLVYRVMRDFASRARQFILEHLKRVDVRAEDISHILFAGGVCRSDVIRGEITGAFPRAQIVQSADPQLQTALGCTKLTDRKVRFAVELAADVAIRQSDNSLCVLMPRGQAMELNSYRIAEFMVTDVLAPEAVFDVGVCRYDSDHGPLFSSSASFQSLRHLFVRTGEPELPGGRYIPDLIRMHIGIESNLTVAVHLHSNRANAQEQAFLSGVPLAIRIEEVKG